MQLKELNNHLPSTIFDDSCSGPCIVIGSGPSQKKLTENSEWKNFYTISVNWSQILFPSQMYCWQDGSFISQSKSYLSKKQFISCSIMPTSTKSLENKHLMQGIGGVYVNRIPTRERPHWIETKNSNTVQSCSPISGAIAMCMAYIMGFNPIIIVGFDCNVGDYKYMKKHPQFGYFNKRAADKHAETQVRLLKTYGSEMNVVNCSETEAITKHDFHKTIKNQSDCNKKRCQKILKDIYIDSCKKNAVTYINQWKNKIPI